MLKLWITALALLFVHQISPMQNESPWDKFESENLKRKALFDAAEAGDLEQVKKLIQDGIDVNTKSTIDVTPLYCAAIKGHEAICKLLIEQGAITTCGYDRKPIWKVVININSPVFIRSYTIAELLLNPHNLPPKKACSQAIITLLHCLKQNKKKNDISLLLSNNWKALLKPHFICIMHQASHDVNQKDKDGDTALMLAARRADASSCKWLIQHGADVNIQNIELHETNTALSIAQKQQWYAASRIGSYLSAPKDYDKATEVCGLLLENGAIEDEANYK
jgi:ankyrin repeat protein